ncbi:UxaA family hydrolase [Marinimicrobium locisalis]|uniref:UxaA family hydrolase n=1 Tax=Marinimicrobium locisalis TaxID=546022 RepID=UPI0032215C71
MNDKAAAKEALILLHPSDNVLVATRTLRAGTRVVVGERPLELPQPLGVGHKMARWDMAQGEKVFKYGAPIGSLLAPVAAGAWVHMHNMTSDYLASHTRRREDRPPPSLQEPKP